MNQYWTNCGLQLAAFRRRKADHLKARIVTIVKARLSMYCDVRRHGAVQKHVRGLCAPVAPRAAPLKATAPPSYRTSWNVQRGVMPS